MKKIIINFLVLLIVGWMGNVYGQQLDAVSDIWLNAQTDDFATIQQQAEDYFADKDKGRGSGYKQWKRWEYLNQNRLTPDGKVTNHSMMNWNAYQQYMGFDGIQKPLPIETDDPEVTNGSWYQLGPTSWINGTSGYNPGIGRINCVAFHPTNANIFYVGAPSGGMWRTTNGGTTWTNLCDGLPAIGVSGIVVQYNNANNIYILTGDGDGGDTKSIGVLKSTNGGTTWATTGLSWDITNNVQGYKLLMHPSNSNILFAVTNTGLFRTSNAGLSWDEEDTGSWRDCEFKPGDPNTMYLSGSSFKRSTDNGLNWTSITSGVPTGTSRMEIGVTPNNSSYVYLLSGPGGPASGQFKGVYRSFDSGLNFGLKTDTPNILNSSVDGSGTSSQYTYDLAIAISPIDVADVITGGINVWKSVDFGLSFTIKTHWNTGTASAYGLEYSHADIHELKYNTLNNYLYCGSDGGIFRSIDHGETWTDLSSGLNPMQFYKIASTPATTSLIIGGTQDNGSNNWSGGTSVTHMYGADGMDCMIDHSNSNIMYFSSQNGGLRKSTNGGSTSSSIKPSGSSGSWVTPYVMNPSNSSIIYAGYSDIYKSTNGGSTWSLVTSYSGSGAIAHGTNNTSRVYASSGSTIVMTTDAGATWSNISAGLPGYTITGITINPDNSPEVWVTLGGFNDGEKVYRSGNAGVSWVNMTGALPNIIVNCIAFEDNNGAPDDAVYIGTDIGVFYRDLNLGEWIPFGNWLPTVPVFDLEIHQTAELITAGTYGRGLWRSSTYTDCTTSWTLAGTAAAGYSYYQASDYITSYRVFDQGVGQEGYFKAANKVTLTTGFQVTGGSKFRAWNAPCGAGIPENENQVNIETPDVYED
ncbi:MAG: hypothetical protein K9G76_10390 [Bacteroidales bacterium]|nr:hypothetical protein [Bacteroidales bacterium]MCF8405245.1 hypothetical protein [Bacteroidales bacterium]